MPEVTIYAFEPSERTQACLRSISPYAIGLEIGPVPQNIFCHNTVKKMETAVNAILEGITNFEGRAEDAVDQPFSDIYTHVENIPFSDEMVGSEFLIHEDLEKKSYQPLQKVDPIFISIQGEVISYAGEENLCPVFVNEAAYYDKNIAFSLVRKIEKFDKFTD